MKILVLEHPRIASEKRFNDIANTPLWSCLMGGYAAAALKREKFDTSFLDEALPDVSFDQTIKRILALSPDLLCVNTVYFWENTSALFDFFSELKIFGFSGHINLFGFFPSLVYRKILKMCDQVDSIAVGEFEHTIVELARSLEKEKSLETIEGLALKSCLLDNKGRMRTPAKNPDVFAFPERSSLKGTITILASRGCYNHCSFCPVPSFYNQGSLWRGRSPENIADEIKGLVAKGGKEFYFCDPNFIGPGTKGKKRIMGLMDLLKPLNIKFGMETRPQDLDDEVLRKIVNAGCESLLMGVESGSSNVLNQIDKSSGPAQSSDAIELCRKYGIEPEIGFLMFVPDSSLNDLKENMSFLMENKLLDRLARTANLLSHTQIVLAGTSGYNRFEKMKRLNKSGIFEFEADVHFLDPAVKWVATLLTFACHTILKTMSNSRSPIFWKNKDNGISQTANNYLVELSYSLIDQALENPENLRRESIKQRKEKILDRINSIIRKA
ncbi:MAG: B12-binding domain-containing radical SAM protein [Desulfobacula sp.]|uniref:B12-binding domain-containing radical SAM protein n=1 Tax=Desulfobacula sp. TaxID=2593537 RepID=UPI0039B8BE34|nr:B12-binding domain-containing radical SAM protein [Desulfobacula sp.]